MNAAIKVGWGISPVASEKRDLNTRTKRMQGRETLWMPGADHAGIATQAVVEKRLREDEGKTRHDIGRDELVRRIWAWKEEFEARIIRQYKAMGCSCDWQRWRFTLDETCARAVRETFFRMFRDGLIYRGQRLVNWDVYLQTAVADDEVYHDEVQGNLWYFRYPFEGTGQHIDLAMIDAAFVTDDRIHFALDDAPDVAPLPSEVWPTAGGQMVLAGDLRYIWRQLHRHFDLKDPTPEGAPLADKIRNRRAAAVS